MIQKEILPKLIYDTLLHKAEDGILHGLEIGTLNGDLAKALLEYIPGLKLISIDHNPNWSYLSGILYQFNTTFQVLHIKSDEAIILLKDKKFDFIWIDGDHEYSQVARDIANYLPLMKKDGIFGGHDYGIGACPGVTKAVDELIKDKNYKLFTAEDGCWWINP